MNRSRIWLALALAGLLLLAGVAVATAAGPSPRVETAGDCLTCHGKPGLSYTYPSGETVLLYVDGDKFARSVHGQVNLTCSNCHPDITAYPHSSIATQSRRDYQIERYQTCATCHDEQYQASLDSMHARSLAAGEKNAAICTDCHGAHYTSDPTSPRTSIPMSCSQCHASIYEEYLGSAHGAALIDENNTDVPTCIDCHGVHNQEDPRSAAFRLNSPELCASCHADAQMMETYGLSTNVFNSYVADFHGTTVTLFERQSPDQPTNKAVCYDCHGVHNMQKASDPNSPTFRENLLKNCQRCHPDADANFPTSWLSHYEPSIEKYPLVYFVELFYKILIPAVLGFMVLYVATDAFGRLLRALRGKKH